MENVQSFTVTKLSVGTGDIVSTPYAIELSVGKDNPLFDLIIENSEYKRIMVAEVAALIQQAIEKRDKRLAKENERLMLDLSGSETRISIRIEQVKKKEMPVITDDEIDTLFLSWETLIGK